MIRVYLADDHPVTREGVKASLAQVDDISLVGEAVDGVEAMEAAQNSNWDILLLDLSLPKKNGWEVLRWLRAHRPDLKIIIVSVHCEAIYAIQALKMGAMGYLTKSADLNTFVKAIRKVHSGERYVSEDLVSDLAGMMSAELEPGKELYNLLTEREMQIFLMICGGSRLTEIAEETNISVKTVSTHRRNILNKLKLESNSEMVRYAMKVGLLV